VRAENWAGSTEWRGKGGGGRRRWRSWWAGAENWSFQTWSLPDLLNLLGLET
jgi:hypothetical protein